MIVEKDYGLFLLKKAKEQEHGALLIKRLGEYYRDYEELSFIYNTEEEQLKHKEFMESTNYECYQCGSSVLYEDRDRKCDNTGLFQYGVRVPKSVFGIRYKGMLEEAKVKFGYYGTEGEIK